MCAEGSKLLCEPLQDMGLGPADVKELTAAWAEVRCPHIADPGG